MPMTPPPVIGTLEAALYADDLSAAEAFYHGRLGLRVLTRDPKRHVFFQVPGSVLLVFKASATEQTRPEAHLPIPVHGGRGPGHYCFAVAADQMEAWRTYLDTERIPVEADFHWPNGARSIYIRDPAGNSVEFADPALWT